MRTIPGIHHITAIAGDPQRNLDFYVGLLGQRFVKRTVNFDDRSAYHFYFADYVGTPGTVMTFFPWPNARRGQRGLGAATAAAYAAPAGTLPAWESRLHAAGVTVEAGGERLGHKLLRFEDPDGMAIELVETEEGHRVQAWPGGPVPAEMELQGFFGVTLPVVDTAASAALLRDLFGWSEVGREGDRTRFVAPAAGRGAPGAVVDLVEEPGLARARMGAGSIHHVAFRAPDDEAQAGWRAALAAEGFGVTPVRDRSYFRSIYFNEPNGVLFEIATDTPGFASDEPLEALGHTLKLPLWMEPERAALEAALPAITVPVLR